MEIVIGIVSLVISTAILIGLAIFNKKHHWLLERLKLSLQKEHTEFLGELNWEKTKRASSESC